MTRPRRPRASAGYPDPIERLLAGRPVPASEEARHILIPLVYFGDYAELPQSVRDEAQALIASWPHPRPGGVVR